MGLAIYVYRPSLSPINESEYREWMGAQSDFRRFDKLYLEGTNPHTGDPMRAELPERPRYHWIPLGADKGGPLFDLDQNGCIAVNVSYRFDLLPELCERCEGLGRDLNACVSDDAGSDDYYTPKMNPLSDDEARTIVRALAGTGERDDLAREWGAAKVLGISTMALGKLLDVLPFERRIRLALADNNGNVRMAADMLGVSATSLRRQMKQFGIEAGD